MRAPRWSPELFPDLERRKHSTIFPPQPPAPSHIHTHTHSRGVYAGIPAWTGGRHFLGMANPVPQPNRGDAVGCNGQRLQESGQAPGVENVSDPRAWSPCSILETWLPLRDWGSGLGLSYGHPRDRFSIHCSSLPKSIQMNVAEVDKVTGMEKAIGCDGHSLDTGQRAFLQPPGLASSCSQLHTRPGAPAAATSLAPLLKGNSVLRPTAPS